MSKYDDKRELESALDKIEGIVHASDFYNKEEITNILDEVLQ